MWLCENYDTDGRRADRNRITGNTLTSYYGILLMGLDDPAENGSPQLVPSSNVLTDNRLDGTTVPAADDHVPAAPALGGNDWSRDTCAGRPCPVVYY